MRIAIPNIFVHLIYMIVLNRCTVPYENIEPIVLPLAKTRCLFINGTQLHAQSAQSVRFRRFKPGRLGEKNSTLREISDKIQCSLPKIQSAMDFNNNQSVCKNIFTIIFSFYFTSTFSRLIKLWYYGVTTVIIATAITIVIP